MTTPIPPAVLSEERIAELRTAVSARAGEFFGIDVDELLALLSAASELVALRARVEALRKANLVLDVDVPWCARCDGEWEHGEPENHLDGCIAAPDAFMAWMNTRRMGK
jgi:hypothetical protein